MKFLCARGWRCAVLLVFGLSSACAEEAVVKGRVAIVDRVVHAKPADNSNVVVWLTPLSGTAGGLAASVSDPGRTRLRLVQKGKRFEPHLLVVPKGAVIDFPNLDRIFHNVFSLFEGKRFDLGLYEAGATRAVRFDRPGVSYIFCNIHPDMSAIVVALETPYHAKSDSAGEITIPQVPGGRYKLQVWHERSLPDRLEQLSREITVGQTASFFGTINVSEAGYAQPAHKNLYNQDYDNPTPSNLLYGQQ